MQNLNIYMKVNGQMIKKKDKENALMQMKIYMKVNDQMIKKIVMENTLM